MGTALHFIVYTSPRADETATRAAKRYCVERRSRASVDVEEGDAGALRPKGLHHFGANARRASRDDGYQSLELGHGVTITCSARPRTWRA